MNINQVFPVKASRDRVWAGLMDPEILRQSIPGCQSVEWDGEDTFDIVVVLRVAGQKIRFSGSVSLEDLVPDTSFEAEGSVKIAGFGFSAANASISLRDPENAGSGQATLVDANVSVNISGKIAFLGERIITRHALRLADEFFRRFGPLVTA
ncbi:CoxG family protein [Arvimicrobium flavum]|uniref:CoxG family protein n=1 Tax=Arvimicrobium flavum TaxID=3393320 RepID=UPI00237BBD52|nr:carbon monoxide dehydrogenase subunit G [Mesorhizobium shangrilense]